MRRGKVGLTLGDSEEELPARAILRAERTGWEAAGASRSAWTGVAASLGAGDPLGGGGAGLWPPNASAILNSPG